ncbi:MAG: AMP-binding protein [Bacteroidales bacterium]|nr:AMP-binding protein [Bacteroidales bacterium]
MERRDSLNLYIQDAIRKNWERLALSDFEGTSLQYRGIARKIAKLHIAYEKGGIKKGDRIALCGRNSALWATAFLSVITYGAVAVPILHDFHPDNIHHLVNHSEARLLFCDKEIWATLKADEMPALEGAVGLHDYSMLLSRNEVFTETRDHLNELFGQKYPREFTVNDVNYYVDQPEELAVINYTSGSMGFSKGVMLPYRALWSNMQFCFDHLTWLKPGDGVVCMLPLAHMYGLMCDMIHCLCKGCHLNFLTRLPSPTIIMKAFATIKPKMIITVPLIIEKIIKTRVFPLLEKPMMKLMLKVPFVDEKLLAKIKEKLTETFGGNLKELIIGGAGLNKDVEAFLRRIKFPFTVGYGMTECAPLIAYAPWEQQRPASCGRIVDRMEAKIDSPDPANIPGVLWVKGTNVMQGYYKNPEATEAVMGEDGWMNTGDICSMDSDGFLYIRGRDKSMILGPSGQNIYPEEIEQVLNNLPYVSESLVVATPDHQLVALIYPDYELTSKENMSEKDIEDIMAQNIKQLNSDIPAYSKVTKFKILKEEFEKTPKRSIKRYLYQNKPY